MSKAPKVPKAPRKRRRLALTLMVIATFFLLMNFNFLKGRVETAASTLFEEPVKIKGDIKLGFVGWRPAALFHDVVIGGDSPKNPEIKADKVLLTLQSLRSYDRFVVSAARLSYEGIPLGNYQMLIRSEKDGFEIDPFKGGLDGGDFKGRVKYVGDLFEAKVNIEGLPLENLIEEADGEIAGDIDLSGRGLDTDSIMRTLKGRIVLTTGEGEITSKALNFWSRDLLMTFLPTKKDETKLHCSILDFNVDDGLAVSKLILVDTEDVTILGKGNIDINSERVDIRLTPKPKDIAVVSMATPVQVKGPFKDIQIVPEMRGMAKKLGSMLLGVVNPALILIPLVESKLEEYHGACGKFIQEQKKSL